MNILQREFNLLFKIHELLSVFIDVATSYDIDDVSIWTSFIRTDRLHYFYVARTLYNNTGSFWSHFPKLNILLSANTEPVPFTRIHVIQNEEWCGLSKGIYTLFGLLFHQRHSAQLQCRKVCIQWEMGRCARRRLYIYISIITIQLHTITSIYIYIIILKTVVAAHVNVNHIRKSCLVSRIYYFR